jgi:tetratricopeptide (TPR) repeat protein
MPYIKCINLKGLGALATLLLLVACGSTPEKMSDAESAQDAIETEVGAEGEAPQISFDLGGPDQNPYLAQEVSAPGAARALFADAIRAMQSQQWSRAETLLQQLISQYPDLSGPYLNLGIVYRQRNQLDKAEEAFAKAVTVNDMNIDALNQLALIKREQGDFRAAETHYLSALAVWPKHDVSHKNLGILYDMYMGELAKALEQFEIYQFLQPEPDRRINGWIIDLQRRISNLQAGAQP